MLKVGSAFWESPVQATWICGMLSKCLGCHHVGKTYLLSSLWGTFKSSTCLILDELLLFILATLILLKNLLCVLVFCLHGYPETEVIDNCELPCGCWELILGPLEEELVLLTTDSFPQAPS